MKKTMTWAAAFAAVVMLGCGGAQDDVAASTKSRSVTSYDPVTYTKTVECKTIGLGDLDQVAIGYSKAGDKTTCDLDYPFAIDSLGNTIDIKCNDAKNVIEKWSVSSGVSVRGFIVRAPDTGTNAYVYEPGVSEDTDLRTPEGEGDDRIYRVKLCIEYVDDPPPPPPEDGCTLTQGYWKTHSEYGPAPTDERWSGLEDEPFFASGATYYEVINAPPSGGNAFFILAHQYIAAKLNGLAGASSTDDVDTAFNQATALFEALEANATTVPEEVRSEAIRLAGILGAYNEGEIGPGHCPE